MPVKNLPLPFQGFDDHDSFSLDQQYGTLFRNVRSNRRRIVRSPGGTLMVPSPVPTGTSSIVSGSLSSPTVTGSVVYTHALGTTPKASIFTGGMVPVDSGLENVVSRFFGFSDSTTHGAHAQAVRGAGGSATHSVNDGVTDACIFLLDPATEPGTVVLKGIITAWDATTFTINWTVVDTEAHPIGYTLIGGAAMSGKVVNWTMNNSTGNQAVTGVGFVPQIVLHFVRDDAGNSMVWGAMTTAGQFSTDDHPIDVNPTFTQRIGTSAKAIASLTVSHLLAPSLDFSATFVSMDADGFTINIDNAPPGTPEMTSLCIAGMGAAKVGFFNKTSASDPVSQSVTGIGFQPDWLLLTGVATGNNNPATQSIRAFGFGIVSETTTFASMVPENDAPKSTMEVLTDAIYAQINTNQKEAARATLTSFDTDGFTLNWPKNSSQANRIYYVALRAGGAQGGVIRNYAQPYVGTTTAVEKIIMLTSETAYIYAVDTPSTGTWTTTAEAYTGGIHKRFSIVNTQGIAAWSQGVNNIRQWDGTTFSALVTSGTDHAAKALIAFADRIISIRPFFAGVDHPTQIRWPINGNVNDWSGAGSGVLEVIETSQAPLITGFVLGERAYLAKQRELIELLWTGTTSPVFGTEPRIRGMGVLAPHSVGLAEQLAFWLGPDDIYMWDGSTLTAIGNRVYNTIDPLIDYNQIDDIQGAVYTPDSLYLLVVPPYLFVYDYRRDIWYQDDTTNFSAIGVLTVGTNFTADIDHSEFIVIGDSAVQTIRLDPTLTAYLDSPIDSYWTTKDYTADQLRGGQGPPGFTVTLWDINSLREVRFQSNAGYLVEVGVSTDRGVTWDNRDVTVNSNGVGVAWFQTPFSQIRFRFRRYGTDAYEIHGSWGFDFEPSGYQYP